MASYQNYSSHHIQFTAAKSLGICRACNGFTDGILSEQWHKLYSMAHSINANVKERDKFFKRNRQNQPIQTIKMSNINWVSVTHTHLFVICSSILIVVGASDTFCLCILFSSLYLFSHLSWMILFAMKFPRNIIWINTLPKHDQCDLCVTRWLFYSEHLFAGNFSVT